MDRYSGVAAWAPFLEIRRGHSILPSGRCAAAFAHWPIHVFQPLQQQFQRGQHGFSLASFLLGQVQNFQIDLQQKGMRPRAWANEYFIQDDWKLTSKLTLNGGLRYTLNFPSTEADNQGAIFNLQTEQLQYLGQDGLPDTGRRLHWLDFGPRVGLAWLATPKTVVRSGYGLIWFDQAGITTPFTLPQFPFLQTVSQNTRTTSSRFCSSNGLMFNPFH
jgi:hypothetical protein